MIRFFSLLNYKNVLYSFCKGVIMNIQKERKKVKKMEKVRKTFMLPKPVFEKLIQYQEENYLTTMTEAVIQLILKGYEADKKK